MRESGMSYGQIANALNISKGHVSYYVKPGSKDESRKRLNGTRERKRDYLRAVKLEKGCVKCGFKGHASALVFHHRDPTQKEFQLSDAPRRNMGWDAIKEEVDKCDVMCSNCHLIHHAQERKQDV